jgi:hypothetical protein
VVRLDWLRARPLQENKKKNKIKNKIEKVVVRLDLVEGTTTLRNKKYAFLQTS